MRESIDGEGRSKVGQFYACAHFFGQFCVHILGELRVFEFLVSYTSVLVASLNVLCAYMLCVDIYYCCEYVYMRGECVGEFLGVNVYSVCI